MRLPFVLLLAAGLVATGCSDDDTQSGNTTTVNEPPTTETTGVGTTSTPPPTTETPTTVDTTSPPTTQEPVTTPPVDEEALKAEIARDYERAYYRRADMLRKPSLRRLEQRVASVLVAGSPAFETFVDRTEELVALGDAVVPNDPDLYSVKVENVELVGQPPYRRAIVTVCEVDNRRQVTLPENSPTGNEIEVAGTGAVQVIRFEEPVRLTDNGWLRFKTPREGIGFEGVTTCPPA